MNARAHADELRVREASQGASARLDWLGVAIDEAANEANAINIGRAGCAADVLAIPTDEEWMIAQHTQDLI